jgi:hypothetical protein
VKYEVGFRFYAKKAGLMAPTKSEQYEAFLPILKEQRISALQAKNIEISLAGERTKRMKIYENSDL